MIRTVADRIASKTRPTYRGRHRRTRSKTTAAFRTLPAAEVAAERGEEALAVPVGGPVAPPT
ncbi:hypothetical protein [Glycomyces arizonensis]|uniref:hypothetical protein n=1 Tax=Glycomyces arizonensis TaxID=256035 RepID=UPI000428B110|nr:hypothetical protein [Glycomyces arizonensis]